MTKKRYGCSSIFSSSFAFPTQPVSGSHSNNYQQNCKLLVWFSCSPDSVLNLYSLAFSRSVVSDHLTAHCFMFHFFPVAAFPAACIWVSLTSQVKYRTAAFEKTALLKTKVEQSSLGFWRGWAHLDPCCFASSAPRRVIDCDLTHCGGKPKGILCNDRL